MSFEHIVREYDIPKSHFFRYLQVRSLVRKLFVSFPSRPTDVWIEEFLDLDPLERGLISRLYSEIQRVASPSLNHLREQWGKDFGAVISDKVWRFAIERIHSTSICVKHRLLQFKIIYRLHLSKSKLAKMFPGTDPTCSRYHQDDATLYHMFWTCPALVPLWTAIFETFSYICDKEIQPDPTIAIFGVAPPEVSLSLVQADAVAFSSLLARRLILLQWKSNNPPTHSQWIESVMTYLKLEKLRYSTRGSSKRFFKVWRPFLFYFEHEYVSKQQM